MAKEMKYHEVQVLMGDFNMSLFRVVPELRSHGIQATLISWFPWRTAESGEVMADSCGIFSLTHADEILPSVQPNILAEEMMKTLPAIQKNAGPGQTLATYLPKDYDLSKKYMTAWNHCRSRSKKRTRQSQPQWRTERRFP